MARRLPSGLLKQTDESQVNRTLGLVLRAATRLTTQGSGPTTRERLRNCYPDVPGQIRQKENENVGAE